MGHLASLKYLWVWFIDFEFRDDAVVCLVARELKTGQTIRLWENELYDLKEAPFDVGASSCIVAYGVGAELSCFEKLGWKLPVNIIDLYPEFLNITNGCPFPDKKRDLLVALKWFGIKRISVEEKEAMRELILSKTSYTPEEKIMILDYCETDVIGLEELFPKIIQKEEFIRIFAEFRGRYSKAINKVSNRGIPMDEQTYKHLHANRPAFRKFLIEKFDTEFQIFENGVFKTNLFERYLVNLHSV